MARDLLVIGSQEWCSLKDIGIPAIRARIDTGAKTSSLHAFNIQPFYKKSEQWVSFEVHPISENRNIVLRCEAQVIDQRNIKSSSGLSEKRFVIKTTVSIGDKSWAIEVTLSNRDNMGFKMLLGREAMKNKLIVNPAKQYVLGNKSNTEIESTYNSSKKNKSGLKIALLASNPELYSNNRIMEAGEERGHDMTFLNVKHCYMKLDAQNPEVHYKGGKILTDIDAIIPRIRPNLTFYGCSLIRQFSSMGIFCLNDSISIIQSRDKLYSLQQLLSKGISIPTTGFANSPLNTTDLINMVGGAPLIVKLLEGTQGKGVVLTETKKAAESVINAFKSLQANILVQEFVKEADGKDLRLFIIDNKVIASIQREAASGEFRANIHQGGTASFIKPTLEEKKLAIKATKALGLKVAGVDIIRSNKGPLVLEVNSSPGLEGIEGATGKDIAGLMITAIEKKLGWRRDLAINQT